MSVTAETKWSDMGGMMLPRIISVDDHVVEQPNLWLERLPQSWKAEAPRVERVKGRVRRGERTVTFEETGDGEWADCWRYDGKLLPLTSGHVAACLAGAGSDPDALNEFRPVVYDEFRPGITDSVARLADMDANHVEASLCFPTFPRFCGQTFLEGSDHELGYACVQAYNDWMIEEWCGGPARGRLIPLTLIPLWDALLAAKEVERCAARGSHAICFSEGPAALGLPSIHSGYWDPLWAACQETDTVVNMHIGSSSTVRRTSTDAPRLVPLAITFEGSCRALADWLSSGILERYPSVRIALSEGQVGWMPYVLERLDNAWARIRRYGDEGAKLTPDPPSSYVPGRVFGCIFDDQAGLALRDRVGMGQIMIETDYPHGDSTWPRSLEVVTSMVQDAGLNADETAALVRGNAIRCYGLDRYFGLEV
jgi:predicted TIM-barrel fold metal-dependent hydrolase